MIPDNDASLVALKTTSGSLRSIGSRALRSAGDDTRANIRRLLVFVKDSPVLAGRLALAEPPTGSPLELLKSASNDSTKLDLPIDEAAELGFLHQLLEEVADWEGEELWRLTYGYGGKRGIRDGLEEFLHDAIQPYLSILNRDVETRILAAGEARTRDSTVSVHVSGGQSQVNIAQSGSRIVAKQEVRTEVSSALRAADELRAAIASLRADGLEGDELLALDELAEGVGEEVARPEPRKQFLQMLHQRLVLVSGSLVAADSIVDKAHALVDAVRDLLN